MRFLKQSTSVDLPIGPFVDQTDGFTAETGLTLTQPDIRLKKNAAAWAQKAAVQTLLHEENGYYEVTLDATDTDTLGQLRLAVNESGALPVWEEFMVMPANVWDSLFGADALQVDVTQLLGTAWLAPGTAGTPDVNVKLWNALATVALPLVPTTAGRTLDVSVGGEAGLDWANIGSPTTAQNLSATNIDVDQIVASVSGAVGSVTGAVGSVTGLTAADVGAIKTQTDKFVFTVANQVDANAIAISGDATAADNAESYFDGTGYGHVLQRTTIATLASQTSFTLTAGSADDNAYNGCIAVIQDAATAAQKAVAVILDYTGATKTVTLLTDPAVFTMATTDIVTIIADRALKATVDNRTLDVSATGEGGLDWANIGSPTTAQNLSATNIDVDQVVASVSGAVGSVTGAVGSVTGLTAATVHADLDDIQARLPAALTAGGNMKSDALALSGDTVAADNAEAFFDGTGYAGTNNVIPLVTTTTTATNVTTVNGLAANVITAASIAADAVTEIRSLVSGTSDSGTTSTMVDAARTEADTDYWKGAIIVFTSGNIVGQSRLITAFTPATDTITFAPVVTQAVATQTYEIWPAGRSDLHMINGVAQTATLDDIEAQTDDIGAAGAGLTALATQASVNIIDDFLDTEIAAIIATLGVAGAGLTDLGGMSTTMKAQVETEVDDALGGGTGTALTAIPWNAAWDVEVQSEVDDALVAQRLDELLNADSDIDGVAPPTVGSVFHELMTKTALSFTYDQTTDSLEAVRDRGDAAWVTATGFATHSAADVWASATRLLTAGTNIVLAKGVGVTGFNDLSAAQVNAEVVDGLNVDTYAEPAQGAPAATASIVTKLGFLHKAWRNKSTQTATDYKLFNDDAVTVDHKATVSDDGSVFTRAEIVSGP